jgi:hypothetical protein
MSGTLTRKLTCDGPSVRDTLPFDTVALLASGSLNVTLGLPDRRAYVAGQGERADVSYWMTAAVS